MSNLRISFFGDDFTGSTDPDGPADLLARYSESPFARHEETV